jgi:uncharacterized tellurite resistance protein B-like protein
MIDRLLHLIRNPGAAPAQIGDDRQLAAAALLIEAGLVDGHFDDVERAAIRRLLVDRLDVPTENADAVLAEAEAQARAATDVWSFARIVKDAYSEDERVDVIEMLWEVVYADGVADDFEANLLRRIAGLLYVPDHRSGGARKRVLERLGIAEPERGDGDK